MVKVKDLGQPLGKWNYPSEAVVSQLVQRQMCTTILHDLPSIADILLLMSLHATLYRAIYLSL